jgi:hypothetical protein
LWQLLKIINEKRREELYDWREERLTYKKAPRAFIIAKLPKRIS